MHNPIVSAPVRPVRRGLVTIIAALFSVATTGAIAQQPPAPPAAKPAPAKPPAKPAQPAQKPAPAKPEAQQPPATPQAQAAPPPDLQLIYSPWTKVCGKGEQPGAKQVCFTGKDARVESGMPVVAAVLIEAENEAKKLNVTLPLGMLIPQGTRLLLDNAELGKAPYVICFPNGCIAEYEASADLVGKLKKGQSLVVQAINQAAQAISLPLPLADFAKAYDGPPTDPKVFEENQKKLQEELMKRADEARKKLESQQGAPPKTQ
jgi:invasion protein IalB